MDYLVKPIELVELEGAVERVARRRDLEIDRRKVERFIREEVELRAAELEHERRRLKALTVGIDETLINAMETKDDFLRGHSEVFTTLQRVVLRRKTLTFIDEHHL